MNTPRTPMRPRRGEIARSVETLQNEDMGGAIGGDVTEICGKCHSTVQDNDNGLQCEKCDAWFHIKCEKVSLELYKALKRASGEMWFCTTCKWKVRSLLETVKKLEQKNEDLQRRMESLEGKWHNLKDTMVRETTHMVMQNLKTEVNTSEAGGATKKELVGDAKEEILRAMKEEEERKYRATNLII